MKPQRQRRDGVSTRVYYVNGKNGKKKKKEVHEYYFMLHGKRYSKSGFASREEAVVARAEHKMRAEQGSTYGISLRELIDYRLKFLGAERRNGHTGAIKQEKRIYNMLPEDWLNRPAVDITKHEWIEFLDQWQDSPSARNQYLAYLKAMYQQGVLDCDVITNPLAGIKRKKIEKKKPYVPPRENLEKIIEVAEGDLKDLLEFIYHTGARIGTSGDTGATGLLKKDINSTYLELRTYKASGSILKKYRFPYLPQLKVLLGKRFGTLNGDSVFPLKYESVYYKIKQICKQLNIPNANPHSWRHSAAVYWFEEKQLPLSDVQILLGHDSPLTTTKYLEGLGLDVGKVQDRLMDALS